MTDKEKALIIIDLIEKITQEIIDKPMQRKRLLQMRGHLEKAVKLTGNGIKRNGHDLPVFHWLAMPKPNRFLLYLQQTKRMAIYWLITFL